MPPEGFEHSTAVSERPQNLALNRAAPGFVTVAISDVNNFKGHRISLTTNRFSAGPNYISVFLQLVTEFIGARDYILSCMKWTHSIPLCSTSFTSILLLFSYVTLDLESCLFLAGFPAKILLDFLSHLRTFYRCRLIWLPRSTMARHAVAQLVEARSYKPESRRFDSRWCHWNFYW